MTWSDYMLMAAKHSKNNAQHWFRYLRKDIDKCGTLFTMDDVYELYNNEALSPFQRVSILAAFTEGSPTQAYIKGLNSKSSQHKLQMVMENYGKF